MKVTFVYLSTGDWVGVYIDGKLYYNHHEIEPSHLLKGLGIECEDLFVDAEGNYPMPELLKEIKK